MKWLSPLSFINERAIWSDLLLALAAVAWFLGRVGAGRVPRLRSFHAAMALYIAATVLSLGFAPDTTLGRETLLLVVELCILALLTSEFASPPRRLHAIAIAVCIVALYTLALFALGLGLFYAGIDTSLLVGYGDLTPSDSYARVAAGFESAPLLGSFCIFGSAVIAREDTGLSPRLRRATQVALAVLVVATLSRAMLGSIVALAIRIGYRHRDSLRVRVAAIAVVAASVGAIAVLTAGMLHLDPTKPTSTTYEFPSPSDRRVNLTSSLDTVAEQPIVGSGPGTLPGNDAGEPVRAHVTPVNIAATTGLPALLAFVFLIVVLWRNRARPIPIATWSGLAGFAVDGMAQDVEHFRHVWVMIGLADADRRR